MFLEGLLKRKGIFMLMLAVAVLCGISPANAVAMPVDSQITVSSTQQALYIEKIQSFLNKSVVQKKLARMGLSKESAMQYVSNMDEAQLAKLSGKIDSIQKASGDGIVILLVIMLIVLCVLYFTDYKVKLEPRRKK